MRKNNGFPTKKEALRNGEVEYFSRGKINHLTMKEIIAYGKKHKR